MSYVYKRNYRSLRERGGGVCDVVQRARVCVRLDRFLPMTM